MRRKITAGIMFGMAVTAGICGCGKKADAPVSAETIQVAETVLQPETEEEFMWTDVENSGVLTVEMTDTTSLFSEPRETAERLQSVSAGEQFSIHYSCGLLSGGGFVIS